MNEQKIDWSKSLPITHEPILTFTEHPKPVGWWIMPGGSGAFKTKFGAYKKPSALVRFSMKHVFGWAWENKE
jgi:hypothetical protein